MKQIKILYTSKEGRELKIFNTLQELSDFIEEQACRQFNRAFNKKKGKILYFKLIKESRKKETRHYKVSLYKNKRILGIANIPVSVVLSPTGDFTISIQKTKYGYTGEENNGN